MFGILNMEQCSTSQFESNGELYKENSLYIGSHFDPTQMFVGQLWNIEQWFFWSQNVNVRNMWFKCSGLSVCSASSTETLDTCLIVEEILLFLGGSFLKKKKCFQIFEALVCAQAGHQMYVL